METKNTVGSESPSVETLIATVLSDIRQKGYSSIQPFDIGEVEERMLLFAQVNGVTLASDRLYMSAKQLQHCMRASKNAKGLVVSDAELVRFPQNLSRWICTTMVSVSSILMAFQSSSYIPITR